MNNEVAILVLSCDKYKNIWKPFLDNFDIFWPDCDMVKYILTNYCELDDERACFLCVGEDISWGANLIKALNAISQKYVLTIFDDLFFSKKINNNRINELIRVFIDKEMNYLQLNYSISHLPQNIEDGIGMVPKGTAYRSSAVMTIWKKKVLMDITNRADSPWSFEIEGSRRTDLYNEWFCCIDENMPFLNLVIKGKYDPKPLKKCKKNGVAFPQNIPVMTNKEVLVFRMVELRSWLFARIIPQKYRDKIRNLLWKKR